MNDRSTISDSELNAYLDGELVPGRRAEIERWLREDLDSVQRLEGYRDLDRRLQALYQPLLEAPVPEELRPPHRGTRRRWDGGSRRLIRVAAAGALVAIGALGGWIAGQGPIGGWLDHQPLLDAHLVRPAAFAHALYSPEVAHPVEIAAPEEQRLVQWLSKRLKTDIRPPNLAAHGYALVGGRLLPSTDRMAAQFMYQRGDGARVTLYVRRGAWHNEATAFRYTVADGVGVFYWIDGPFGYALVGELPRAELLRLSETVYRDLG